MSGGGAFRFHIEDVTSTYGYWYYFQNQGGNWRIIIYRTGAGLAGAGAASLTGNVDTGIAVGAATLRGERIITDGSTVTVKAYIDGIERASATDTNANRVDGTATTGFGMFSGTTNYTFDNFAAGPV